jgi:hypothetical protein
VFSVNKRIITLNLIINIIYKETTHANVVLNYNSHHPHSIKLGVAIGQFKRVYNMCNNPNTLKNGFDLIRSTLRNSNYPEHVIEKAYAVANLSQPKILKNNGNNFIILRLPFINERFVRSIRRCLKNLTFSYKIYPVYYTGNNLSDIIIRSDLPTIVDYPSLTLTCEVCSLRKCICDLRNIVYILQCNECLKYNMGSNVHSDLGIYIGETGRQLKIRINEHMNAIRKNDIKGSAMVEHFNDVHANIGVQDRTFKVNLLEKCNGFLDRKILEAINIFNFKPDINKNTGLFLTT